LPLRNNIRSIPIILTIVRRNLPFNIMIRMCEPSERALYGASWASAEQASGGPRRLGNTPTPMTLAITPDTPGSPATTETHCADAVAPRSGHS
jgi:hypothetical protein